MKLSRFLVLATLLVAFVVSANAQTARVQVIHNSADPAAASVDIYLNGTLLVNDFQFRKATPFIDAPAGVPLEIGVAPGTSTSANDVIAKFPVTLDANQTYVVLATGVLDPTKFAANPEGKATGFNLYVKTMGREKAVDANSVEFFAFHGATDAPAVNVVARDVATLVSGAAYGDMTDYLAVPPAKYLLDVYAAGATPTIVATFEADLSGLVGGAATVFASGFLNPAANQNGPAFGLFAVLPTGGDAIALPLLSTARLQVIHNAADPAAAGVDIYLNGGLLLDNFGFRKATPFIDAPANTPLSIAVAPGTSSSVNDALATFNVTLMAGKTYVVLATGVLDPTGFAANPEGKSTGFNLYVQDMGQEAAKDPSLVELFAFHGATDAPAVNVVARDVATLVSGAAYGDLTGYLAVPPAKYLLDIYAAGATPTIVATFEADLSGLAGGAAAVFASGFLNPAANQNGAGFGLLAALPTGDVVELPLLSTARLQVIHNAADPAAFKVDVYVNGGLLLDDFRFRRATPYIDAPANTLLTISVAPSMSASVVDALASFDVTLMAGETYLVVANGVLDPTKFAANPDGKSTGFNLYVKKMARETAMESDKVDFLVFHGATDAPMVDVLVRGLGTVVDNAGYGDMTDYLTVGDKGFLADLTLADDNSAVVASYKGGFYKYAGSGAVVFASGFLSPDDNMNGPAFGLYVAYPDGHVAQFTALTTARLQVIHNAADPAAASVDVYVNGGLLLDDFGFRKATPFIDVPANTNLAIGIAPGNSTSASDVIKTINVSLLGGATYVAVANGVLGTGFAANPEGLDIAFQLLANDDIREKANWTRFVEFVVLHGSTDAPAVDVLARGVGTLIDNLAYGQFSDYLRVWPGAYTLDITPANDNNTVVVSYNVDLNGLKGGSAVVFASGFLNPAANNNGAGFGLLAALPNGAVVEFPVASGLTLEGDSEMMAFGSALGVPTEFSLGQNYPNPFNPTTTISFALPQASNVSLKVYDIVGREVASLVDGQLNAGLHQVAFDASSLASGKYFYRIEAGSFNAVKQMVLLK